MTFEAEASSTLLRHSTESVDSASLSDDDYDPKAFRRVSESSSPVESSDLEWKAAKVEQEGSRIIPKWLIPTKSFWLLTLVFFVSVALLILVNGWSFFSLGTIDGQSPAVYPTPLGGTMNEWAESYQKAAAMVGRMTLVEKVNITTGVGWMMGMCVGNTGPVPRLGFPSLCLQDSPLGPRYVENITAFPAGITTGATWNPDLMFQRGRAMGMEARLKGINNLLGPVPGPLGRSPLGGRNWEGFGADPVLQGRASAETIKGIQSEGVMATVKHFLANEQEHFRRGGWEWRSPQALSSNLDDRTLHELYAWPFADSVRAGVASVMCSYNQVNNSYGCQNSKLMNGILKDELGFQGFVQSDWNAMHSGVASALAGLDMAMPGNWQASQDGKSYWGQQLTTAVLNGSVPMTRLNDMATRIVAAWYQLGQDDKSKWADGPNFSSWTKERVGRLYAGSDDTTTGVVNRFVNAQGEGDDFHGTLARKIAAEGTVLLKNTDGFLPLKRSGWPNGKPANENRKYRVGLYGEDAQLNPNGINSCRDRGCNVGTLASGWGSGTAEFPYLIAPSDALRAAFDNSSVEVSVFPQNSLSGSAASTIAQQDLCMVFINSDAGEGYLAFDDIKGDRNNLYAQRDGDKLAQDVSKQCGNGHGDVIVVIHAVGPVLVENFVDLPNVKALLFALLPGQESGNALADIIFGDVNPSGRLPFTIGKSLEDYGPSTEIITKTLTNTPIPQANFTEGLLIDYRHFDYYNITPRYEFGFGLSYSQWHLSNHLLRVIKAKTPLPGPRPAPQVEPPEYNQPVPDPKEALFPRGFHKVGKYVYPYLTSISGIRYKPPPSPPPSSLSPAGGGLGGNPSLYETFATVSAFLTNKGPRPGSCPVQLYVSLPANYTDPETNEHVEFPVRTLRNFQKYTINKKNDRATVLLALTRRDLSYWSTVRGNWVLPTKGQIQLELGFSSRNIIWSDFI